MVLVVRWDRRSFTWASAVSAGRLRASGTGDHDQDTTFARRLCRSSACGMGPPRL